MTDQGRWTKPAGDAGEDPREIDVELHDPDEVERLREARPVTHDQQPTGEQGATTDQPGVDPGGYPEAPPAEKG